MHQTIAIHICQDYWDGKPMGLVVLGTRWGLGGMAGTLVAPACVVCEVQRVKQPVRGR